MILITKTGYGIEQQDFSGLYTENFLGEDELQPDVTTPFTYGHQLTTAQPIILFDYPYDNPE